MTRGERCDLLARLRRDARLLGDAFALRSFRVEADRRSVRHYGICHRDGVIRIRLAHRRTGEPLRYSSMVDTLCHELAHLRHFNHGPAFKAFYLELLAWARQRGIYRPQPRTERERPTRPAHARPVQLELFA